MLLATFPFRYRIVYTVAQIIEHPPRCPLSRVQCGCSLGHYKRIPLAEFRWRNTDRFRESSAEIKGEDF